MTAVVLNDAAGVPRHISFPTGKPVAGLAALGPQAQADDFLLRDGGLLALPAAALGVPLKKFNGYLFKERTAIPLDAEELLSIPKRVPGIHLCNMVIGGKFERAPCDPGGAPERRGDQGRTGDLHQAGRYGGNASERGRPRDR